MKTKHLLRQAMEDAIGTRRTGVAACPHFGECGGCEYQDVPYPVQVEAKAATLRVLAERLGMAEHLPLERMRVVESPRPLRYRQRMDYVCAFGKSGLRRRRSHKWVVPLETCHLIGERAFAAFRRAEVLAREAGMEDYNYLAHRGELRYVVVRQTRSGSVLLSFVTKTDGVREVVDGFARTLLEEGDADSVHWLWQPGLADLSFGTPMAHWGAATIPESYLGMRFRIGPNTFFQANPDVAELAYAEIRGHVRAHRPDRLLDLYSGTGVIAMLCAGEAGTVCGVETVPDNLALAETNRAENGCANVTMIEAEAERYLADPGEVPDYLVVNPPRVGLEEAACRRILALRPRGISYMSCNPVTLLHDLRIWVESFHVDTVTLYDMFPQTHHWETVVSLTPRAPGAGRGG